MHLIYDEIYYYHRIEYISCKDVYCAILNGAYKKYRLILKISDVLYDKLSY